MSDDVNQHCASTVLAAGELKRTIDFFVEKARSNPGCVTSKSFISLFQSLLKSESTSSLFVASKARLCPFKNLRDYEALFLGTLEALEQVGADSKAVHHITEAIARLQTCRWIIEDSNLNNLDEGAPLENGSNLLHLDVGEFCRRCVSTDFFKLLHYFATKGKVRNLLLFATRHSRSAHFGERLDEKWLTTLSNLQEDLEADQLTSLPQWLLFVASSLCKPASSSIFLSFVSDRLQCLENVYDSPFPALFLITPFFPLAAEIYKLGLEKIPEAESSKWPSLISHPAYQPFRFPFQMPQKMVKNSAVWASVFNRYFVCEEQISDPTYPMIRTGLEEGGKLPTLQKTDLRQNYRVSSLPTPKRSRLSISNPLTNDNKKSESDNNQETSDDAGTEFDIEASQLLSKLTPLELFFQIVSMLYQQATLRLEFDFSIQLQDVLTQGLTWCDIAYEMLNRTTTKALLLYEVENSLPRFAAERGIDINILLFMYIEDLISTESAQNLIPRTSTLERFASLIRGLPKLIFSAKALCDVLSVFPQSVEGQEINKLVQEARNWDIPQQDKEEMLNKLILHKVQNNIKSQGLRTPSQLLVNPITLNRLIKHISIQNGITTYNQAISLRVEISQSDKHNKDVSEFFLIETAKAAANVATKNKDIIKVLESVDSKSRKSVSCATVGAFSEMLYQYYYMWKKFRKYPKMIETILKDYEGCLNATFVLLRSLVSVDTVHYKMWMKKKFQFFEFCSRLYSIGFPVNPKLENETNIEAFEEFLCELWDFKIENEHYISIVQELARIICLPISVPHFLLHSFFINIQETELATEILVKLFESEALIHEEVSNQCFFLIKKFYSSLLSGPFLSLDSESSFNFFLKKTSSDIYLLSEYIIPTISAKYLSAAVDFAGNLMGSQQSLEHSRDAQSSQSRPQCHNYSSLLVNNPTINDQQNTKDILFDMPSVKTSAHLYNLTSTEATLRFVIQTLNAASCLQEIPKTEEAAPYVHIVESCLTEALNLRILPLCLKLSGFSSWNTFPTSLAEEMFEKIFSATSKNFDFLWALLVLQHVPRRKAWAILQKNVSHTDTLTLLRATTFASFVGSLWKEESIRENSKSVLTGTKIIDATHPFGVKGLSLSKIMGDVASRVTVLEQVFVNSDSNVQLSLQIGQSLKLTYYQVVSVLVKRIIMADELKDLTFTRKNLAKQLLKFLTPEQSEALLLNEISMELSSYSYERLFFLFQNFESKANCSAGLSVLKTLHSHKRRAPASEAEINSAFKVENLDPKCSFSVVAYTSRLPFHELLNDPWPIIGPEINESSITTLKPLASVLKFSKSLLDLQLVWNFVGENLLSLSNSPKPCDTHKKLVKYLDVLSKANDSRFVDTSCLLLELFPKDTATHTAVASVIHYRSSTSAPSAKFSNGLPKFVLPTLREPLQKIIANIKSINIEKFDPKYATKQLFSSRADNLLNAINLKELQLLIPDHCRLLVLCLYLYLGPILLNQSSENKEHMFILRNIRLLANESDIQKASKKRISTRRQKSVDGKSTEWRPMSSLRVLYLLIECILDPINGDSNTIHEDLLKFLVVNGIKLPSNFVSEEVEALNSENRSKLHLFWFSNTKKDFATDVLQRLKVVESSKFVKLFPLQQHPAPFIEQALLEGNTIPIICLVSGYLHSQKVTKLLLSLSFSEAHNFNTRLRALSCLFLSCDHTEIQKSYKNKTDDLLVYWQHLLYLPYLEELNITNQFADFYKLDKLGLAFSLWSQYIKADQKDLKTLLLLSVLIADFNLATQDLKFTQKLCKEFPRFVSEHTNEVSEELPILVLGVVVSIANSLNELGKLQESSSMLEDLLHIILKEPKGSWLSFITSLTRIIPVLTPAIRKQLCSQSASLLMQFSGKKKLPDVATEYSWFSRKQINTSKFDISCFLTSLLLSPSLDQGQEYDSLATLEVEHRDFFFENSLLSFAPVSSKIFKNLVQRKLSRKLLIKEVDQAEKMWHVNSASKILGELKAASIEEGTVKVLLHYYISLLAHQSASPVSEATKEVVQLLLDLLDHYDIQNYARPLLCLVRGDSMNEEESSLLTSDLHNLRENQRIAIQSLISSFEEIGAEAPECIENFLRETYHLL
eukprot:GHVP01037779.1.p1 GENE.GHVP01037779.1~~GHVP01037779.1.p1  ORF type:complete len:2104 (+),score=367.24 GHVP01037779.1:1431-7742(+)